MLNVLLRLLPKSSAQSILTLLRGVNVANPEPRAVGVEAHHVYFARNVDRSLEAIRLSDQQVGGVSAVAGPLNAQSFGVGYTHLDQLVGGRGHAFAPCLTGKPDCEIHRRLHHRVPIRGQNVDSRVERVVEELLVDVEHSRILLARLMIRRVVEHPVLLVSIYVEIRDKLGLAESFRLELRIGVSQTTNVLEVSIGGVDVAGEIAAC